jgi:hypothetical protein
MTSNLNNNELRTEPVQVPQKGSVITPRKRETKQERRRRVRQGLNQLFLEREARKNSANK